MEPINVLSLFDGMSCGQIALERVGISVANYYAAEIDKHAISVAKHNWPEMQHMGDVNNWKEWPIDWSSIDLIIAGSPCQGFSFAGKQLAFDDPRSKLFFVFVDIVNHIKKLNPNLKFLLENVRMKKDYLAVISEQLGVPPVFINSNLVCAQNRPRYYWTNWHFEMPEDRGIFLADILEQEVSENYIISENYVKRLRVSDDLKKRFSAINPKKALCMTARQYANWKGTLVVALTERRTEEAKRIRSENMKQGRDFSPRRGKELTERSDNKMNCLTATYSMKEHTLIDGNEQYRKLTPVECERLQTVPDNYTSCVADGHRYKMLGNGWTVDVIAHIFEAVKPIIQENQEWGDLM